MKFVLVAGASGYLGRHVIAELKQKGYRVRALVRQRDVLWKRGETLAPAVGAEVDEIAVGDLTQPASLKGVCRNIQVVISCAGLPRTPGSAASLTHEQLDYHGNRNLLIEAIQTGGVEKFVFVSHFQNHLNPQMPIIEAKNRFMEDLQKSVMTSYTLRPHLFFSELLPFVYLAKTGRVWLPETPQKFNPIHGRDVGVACVKGILAKEKEQDLGGPVTHDFESIARIAFKALEMEPKIHSGAMGGVVRGSMSLFQKQQAEIYNFLKSPLFEMGMAPESGKRELLKYFQAFVQSPFFRPD
jgi:uncharacterized protein YbjT (DUF2867 family)